ncbi:MAG: uroporphyrinogen decarboxylase family protein, partial [Armatimonadota bacterium]|nr:uroporphyrinogen decarboxylase family protein [Armatimonadota bacterium]
AREVNPDVFVAQHHCGKVDELIPDFIEIGTNALNPIQPECMDVLDLKRRFGDVLTLWGTVGAQSVFPFGTADQIRQTVRDNIRNLGYNGGLWIAPSQILEPEAPWGNIEAFFDAVEEFGRG